MIFLKQFDVSSQTLLGVTKRYIQRGSKVQDIIPLIQEMMGWPASTPVKLYEVHLLACLFLCSFL
jgi:ubiquitin carboxyl-terminal hydrolase 7